MLHKAEDVRLCNQRPVGDRGSVEMLTWCRLQDALFQCHAVIPTARSAHATENKRVRYPAMDW